MSAPPFIPPPSREDARAAPGLERQAAHGLWRVLLAGADGETQRSVAAALAGRQIEGRPLALLHAQTAAQARAMLASEADLAVLLLGAALEADGAGLALLAQIRAVRALGALRIIVCGGAGSDPVALGAFDISACISAPAPHGAELVVALTAAVRNYRQLCALEAGRRGLERLARSGAELTALHGMPAFGAAVLAQAGALLGGANDAVLCCEESANGAPATLCVSAGSGRYGAMPPGPLAAGFDARAAAALRQALAQRRHAYLPDSATLYLGARAGRACAAFLPLTQPAGPLEQGLLEVFCQQVALGLDKLELAGNLHNAAYYDQLSNLPNRTRLIELLEATLAGPARAAATLALVDLDHFAETNDALGHQFGDLLLVAVGERLQNGLGRQLTVARMGGDLFCVLGDSTLADPAAIVALFDAPYCIDGQDVRLSATLGLLRLGEHDGNASDALKDADIALKRAKHQQRTGHVYFTRGMGVEIRERVRMMHALRAAFGQRQLFLVYQPQIALATRTAVGAEALLRWQTPDGKFISPDRFIPIAEYSGLIVELGQWVLHSACTELLALRARGLRDFVMSVNVSQVQFRHPHFLDMLRAVLRETGAPPHQIELEITESMAMDEPDVLIKMLWQIKQIGLSIAIDDFGTGFSSLSYLQRLQIDRLKIDRAFVTEITGSARGSSIAQMVIQLGHNLGLQVIAEGVEDERQAQVLQALGCPLAQGFLFAQPMTAPALAAWLDEEAPARAAPLAP